MTYRLDPLDRRLISVLKLDGRMSYSELSERLNVSEGTARNRLTKLIDSGAVQIVPAVEPEIIGFRLNIWIGIVCRPGEARHVSEAVAQYHPVRYVAASTGIYDVICEAVFLSQPEMLRFLEDDLRGVDGIMTVQTAMVLKIAKSGWEWELREEANAPSRRDRDVTPA